MGLNLPLRPPRTLPPLKPPHWPGWRHLPREARDTLFLLGVIAWVVTPHLFKLPWWCTALVVVVLAWRATLALSDAALPSRWGVMGLLVMSAALTWWTEGTLLGKEPGVTMLVLLMALKTLELRARRDAMVVFLLGFFLVLTHFLYSQSIAIALAMGVSVWGLLTALVLAHMPVGRPPLRQAAGAAARATLLGVPVMVVLFVLFPRIGPLWGLPQDAAGRTGLSGSLRMGGVAQLAQDDSIAMRLRFLDPAPPPQAMYFRGPVLGAFDGREWTRLRPTFGPARSLRSELQVGGTPVRYEVTLEPSRLPLLPLLEATPDRPGDAPAVAGLGMTLGADLQWRTDRPLTERVRFEARAWTDYRHGPRAPVLALRDLVDLPAGYNPRTLEWAAALRRQPRLVDADARTLAAAVLDHIRGGSYYYTLEPGTYGRDAIDEFWFDRKLGFCEHFASAFVVIMRALDVPARIVTGYQGTDPRPVDGYWTVRQSNAHAWAEYWQPGEGWVRADPTAAVAPERIVRSQSLVAPQGFVGQAIGTVVSPQLVARLRALWETVDNRWNQWVLGYSRARQFNLLERLGIQSPDWADLGYLLAGLLGAGGLAGAGWALWDRQRQDPWQRLQGRVQARLARLGVPVAPHEGPRTRAERVRSRLGADGAGLAETLLELERLRYAPAAHAPGLRSWWRRFAQAAAGARAASALLVVAAILGAGMAAPGAGEALAGEAVNTERAERAAERAEKADRPAKVGKEATAMKAKKDKRDAKAETPPRIPPKTAKGRKPTEAAQAADGTTYGPSPAVRAFAEAMAAEHGLDAAWVERHLAGARRLPAVQRLIMPPPTGTPKNWAAYRARFIEPGRIEAGVRFWRAHAPWLARAEARWGVPAEIVVGIVGVETFYGRHTGSFRALDALATLAFDFPPGRRDRSEFFRGELAQLLLLADRERVDPAVFKGSYAGALGLPQFMPGSINRWAVDFDEDGHIDLLGNPADTIGSVAHYLASFGWQSGLPTHYPVTLPADEADRAVLLAPDIVPSFTAAQFIARGADLDSAARAHDGLLALVELENGDAPPSHVAGTSNFYVITRYNWSSYYAMAVIELGQAVRRAYQGPP